MYNSHILHIKLNIHTTYSNYISQYFYIQTHIHKICISVVVGFGGFFHFYIYTHTKIYKSSHFQPVARTETLSGKTETRIKVWMEYLLAIFDCISDFTRASPLWNPRQEVASPSGTSERKRQIQKTAANGISAVRPILWYAHSLALDF